MRKTGLLLLLLLAACAPVATLMPARPATAPGGAFGLSVFYNKDTGFSAPFPYLALFWGDGEKEFGVFSQLGAGAYAKFRLAEGFSLRASVGVPGPWYEGALLYDLGPLTLSGRFSYGREEWNGRVRYLWLGEAAATYWYQGLGFEAGLLFGEGGWNPIFSVGYWFELPAGK